MFKKSLFALIAVLMVIMVCSCGAAKDRAEALQDEVLTPAEAALEKLKAVPEYPEGYPTPEDVVSQYKKTCQAIGWIVGTELIATDGDYGYDANGLKYYKVLPDCYLGEKQAGKDEAAEQLIFDLETLEAYYATLISADEAHDYVLDINESFEVPRLVENENGELYALPYAFPPAGYADDSTDTFELIANKDGSYTLVVHYNTLDDEDNIDGEYTYKVKYVKKDGRWVFENFLLVKQH